MQSFTKLLSLSQLFVNANGGARSCLAKYEQFETRLKTCLETSPIRSISDSTPFEFTAMLHYDLRSAGVGSPATVNVRKTL